MKTVFDQNTEQAERKGTEAEPAEAAVEKEGHTLRFEDLLRERQVIKNESGLTFGLGRMVQQGGQQMIAIFGVKKVIEAMKAVTEDESVPVEKQNLHEALKILEPDKKKRQALYARMDDEADAWLVRTQKLETEGTAEERVAAYESLTNGQYGATGNVQRGINHALTLYRACDSLPYKVVEFLSRAVSKYPDATRFLDTIPHDINVYAQGGWEKIEEELDASQGDLSRLTVERWKKVDEWKGAWREQADTLARTLQGEIDATQEELHGKFAEKTLALISDLQKIADAQPENEQIIASIEATAESELQQYQAAYERELAAATQEKRKILGQLDSLKDFRMG